MESRPVLRSLPLSTDSDESARCYWEGVAALVGGLDHADELLARAVHTDPVFFLAHVAIATVTALGGVAYRAPVTNPRVLRGERQHAEIVAAHFAGRDRRVADLRREHLFEYPTDLLVVWLPSQPVDREGRR